QAAHRQLDTELMLARRLQANFLPRQVPTFPRGRVVVHHHPSGRVGGDFYDAFRVDENHVGFYVADALGHGVPASLLTMFIKQNLRPKEVARDLYRLIPPDEVLARLNRELIEQRLSETPFVSMVYGLFNHQTGALSLARAGHPFALFM